jgi:NAD(P) transhydrogenase
MPDTTNLQGPQEFDVIVIGSGPGGEGAAMRATKGQARRHVEKYREVGGGCTHWATIPSKALRHSVRSLLEFRHNPLFAEGSSPGVPARSPSRMLLRSASAVIQGQVAMRRGFYDRNRVPIFHGHARFVDPHTIEVEARERRPPALHAANFVIATGSRPYRPPDVDFTHPRIFDSDTILRLDHTPEHRHHLRRRRRRLRVRVDLPRPRLQGEPRQQREKLLSFLDDEIIDALSYHLRDQGVRHPPQRDLRAHRAHDDGVVLHLKSGKKIKSDLLLWANGRTGNTQELGLEATSASVANGRGQIEVDEFTTAPAPTPTSTPSATSSATPASPPPPTTRAASPPTHLDHRRVRHPPRQDIPTGIYTNPEISSIGRTERELTAEGSPTRSATPCFAASPARRSPATASACSSCSSTARRCRSSASTASAIRPPRSSTSARRSWPSPATPTPRYFINTTFNYPTMAEAYRVAALNGINRLF